MEPLVSVIMPVYNQEEYLDETIESVLNQNLKNFEFIILDDGSTDHSAQIIRRYAQKDTRIRPFFFSNSGKCTSTNFLVSEAKAKYCAFLDADDIMLPERLETQVSFHLNNPEIDATSCHCFYINERGKLLGIQYYPGLESLEKCKIVKENKLIIQCSFTGLMTSKNCYTKLCGLDPDKWPCEDFDFFNRLIENGYYLIIIQKTLMKYRIHQSAITMKNPLYMFDKNSWVYDCIALRRAGQRERSFDAFMESRKKESFWKKFTRQKYQYSQIYFRKAGVAMMSRMYFNFIGHFSIACVLSPGYVWLKLRRLSKKISI